MAEPKDWVIFPREKDRGNDRLRQLVSDELKERYQLSDDTIRKIRDRIMRDFGEIEGVLEETTDGFIAYLQYQIFQCQAKDIGA